MDTRIPDLIAYLRHPALRNYPALHRLAWKVLRMVSSLGLRDRRKDFADIEAFCLFVGHPRSGHTVVGSLLDAHPRMVIAHELHALKCLDRGLSTEELYYLLIARSRRFARENSEWGGYKYDVPQQHKGKYTTLKVIGDKKGGGTSGILLEQPSLLSDLKRTVSVPVKVIHVTRHPLDNIATMAKKHHKGNVDTSIDHYFKLFKSVESAKNETEKQNWSSFSLEYLIENTKECLQRLCGYLGVDASESYLEDCDEMVFDEPSLSRMKVNYTPEQIEDIRSRSSRHSSLSEYEFTAGQTL
jgi:hypothetical protein